MKIGMALPITEGDDGTQARYGEMRALALQAEDADFDSVWVFDHLIFRHEGKEERGVWEAWTILSALAEATSRVELGTLVLCTAFRNPAVFAKMADAIEEVSDGRLICGIGAGWHEPEFDAFGLPFDHRASRFEEALQIIHPLLRTGEVNFHGTYSQAPNAVSRPRGPRPNGPPILIGTLGERMLRLTARYADAWNTCWLGQPTLLAERRAKLEAACADVGRDPATVEVTVGVGIEYPDLKDGPTEPVDPDKALSGTPDEIAAGFQAYADLGVSHIICHSSPNTADALTRLSEALALYRRSAS